MTVKIIVEFNDGDITKGNYTFTDIESIELVRANDFAITEDQKLIIKYKNGDYMRLNWVKEFKIIF